jgi:exonuclease SbcD
MSLADLEAALADMADGPEPGLRPLLYVELAAGTDAPAVVMGQAEALLRAVPVRTAGIRIHRATAEGDAASAAPAPALSLKDTRPEDLFVRAFTLKHGIAPGDRHLAGFRDIAGDL